MDNENKTIHDFDFTFICDYFKSLERQGPGSPENTLRALSFIEELPDNPQIADLGCGTGGQTMTLARHMAGIITGVDIFPEFIEIFNRNAGALGFGDRVKGVVGSMDDPPFAEGSLDLIWAEGSIYNIGFEAGLGLWHKYLKPGGWVAVSEATWFTPARPQEIHRFWMDSYPGIDTIPAQVAKIEKAGYIPVAHFVVPQHCWTEHYYAPQEPAREAFLGKYAGNQNACDFIASQRHEQSLYDKYKEYYGYVFYIGRKA